MHASIDKLHAQDVVFGSYRIIRRIGAGGMGTVYEAEHVGLRKRVALKALHPQIADNDQLVARLLREGEATSRIRHPHIVDVTDVGLHDGIPYLVMEYLEGEDLATLLTRDGRLSPQGTADLMVPVLTAVAAAHAAGVIHRDLKPENIFLARTLHGVCPKVLDFGVSRLIDRDDPRRLTGDAILIGTPEYMSPEQTRGSYAIDARSDQYALGVILYECVTGRRPFSGDSMLTMLTDVAEGNYVAPTFVRNSLPDAFETLIVRAMSREPGDRFASVHALARAVLPYASAGTKATWSEKLTSTHSIAIERSMNAAAEQPWPSAACVDASPVTGCSSIEITMSDEPTSEPLRIIPRAQRDVATESSGTPGVSGVSPVCATPAARVAPPLCAVPMISATAQPWERSIRSVAGVLALTTIALALMVGGAAASVNQKSNTVQSRPAVSRVTLAARIAPEPAQWFSGEQAQKLAIREVMEDRTSPTAAVAVTAIALPAARPARKQIRPMARVSARAVMARGAIARRTAVPPPVPLMRNRSPILY